MEHACGPLNLVRMGSAWSPRRTTPLARVWDADTGEPLTDPLKHGASVHSAQFSPDGQRVATACWDGAAQVWDARTGQPLASPLNMEQRWQPWSPLSLVQMGRT